MGLGEVAREAVEDEAAAGVRLAEALADHAEHQGVIHQAPTLHCLLGLAAKLGALGHGSAQQVAGGDLRDVHALYESLRLSALTRSGRAQQNNAHVFPQYEIAAAGSTKVRHVTGRSRKRSNSRAGRPPGPCASPAVRYSSRPRHGPPERTPHEKDRVQEAPSMPSPVASRP